MTAPLRFSPTQIRVAAECPRLYVLSQREGGSTQFGGGQSLGLGRPFHRLAAKLLTLLRAQPQLAAEALTASQDADGLAQALRRRCWDLFLGAALTQAAQSLGPQKMVALDQAFRRLIELTAEMLIAAHARGAAPMDAAQSLVAPIGCGVSARLTLPDGREALIRGQYDALLYDAAAQCYAAIEFKTYPIKAAAAPWWQAGVYAAILSERLGCPVDCTLVILHPDPAAGTVALDRRALRHAEIEETIRAVLPQRLVQMADWRAWRPGEPPPPAASRPELCQICPRRARCQSLFVAPSPAPRPIQAPVQTPAQTPAQTVTAAPAPTPPTPEKPAPEKPAPAGARWGVKVAAALRAYNVQAELLGEDLGPSFIRVRLKPALGVKVAKIAGLSPELQVALTLSAPPMMSVQPGCVAVDLPRPDRQTARLESYGLPTGPQAAIGVGLDGRLVCADLSDPNSCHFLIGGATGSGKSEFLRAFVASLTAPGRPPTQVALIDVKRVTFMDWSDAPWLWRPPALEAEAAATLLEAMTAEMDRRYRLFEQVGVNRLDAYNDPAAGRDPLPRLATVIDEFADLTADPEVKPALEQAVKRIGALGRAAGVHLAVATQRPEARVVSPLIRSNLPARVALRVTSEADSTIILGAAGEGDASKLLGRGDLLYRDGSGVRRLQAVLA